MPDTVILIVDGIPHELPLVAGTEGERAADISGLHSTTGLIAPDGAYSNTGSCGSVITLIDGECDVLQYHGVPIEDLAPHSSFIEVAELLIFGDLPGDNGRGEFRQLLTENSALHRDMHKHFSGFPVDAHPMAILSVMINTIQAYDLPKIYITGEAGLHRAVVLLLTKTRTITAVFYKNHIGQPIAYPCHDPPYAENFLHMIFTVSYRGYEVAPETVHVPNMFFVLHVNHGQNYSTSTARVVASSGTSLSTAASAGVMALWGPLHGGANIGVIEMLEQIRSESMSADSYLARAKDRKSGIRLMEFGHRVYRSFDPRARILKKVAHDLLESMNIGGPLFDIAREIEEAALADGYFTERRLYPNVDFHSDIALWVIGIPLDIFTVLFTIGCTAGWIAHWKEVNGDPAQRIRRSRQLYTGNEFTK